MPAPDPRDPITEAAWGDAPPPPPPTAAPVATPAAQTAPAAPPAASNVVPLHPIAQAAGPVAPPTAPANTNMARPPDPIGDVVRTINSGESGGADPYHELYGGGHFGFPQWSGAQGPQGITHAAGAGQWEPGTWTQAAKFWMSQNPGKSAPDFNRPVDQDKVQRLWAIKTYGVDGNGNTLSKAAAAGKVDYGRLAGQWPSLKRLLPHNEQEQLAGADREREAS
jgi:muramidase (phage lysozyme)